MSELHVYNSGGMCDEKTVEYLRDLIAEKQRLEEHIANTAANNRNYQGDANEGSSTNATENDKPSTSSSHAPNNVNNNGATKTIAQRLLDQGMSQSFQNLLICH